MDWRTLECGGVPVLFRVDFKDGQWSAYLWDFQTVFVEEVEREKVLERAENRNRSFDLDMECLTRIFQTKPKEANLTEDRSLVLKYYFEGIPFHFTWNLRENRESLSKIIAIPLLWALKKTKDRETELLKIIEKKDVELQDMKRRDPLMINKFLETKPMDTKVFDRSTEWDLVNNPEETKALESVVPGISASGFTFNVLEEIPVGEEKDIFTNQKAKAKKRDILKKIQGAKMGHVAVELTYGMDSQESMQDDEDKGETSVKETLKDSPKSQEIPLKKEAPVSQRSTGRSPLKTKRKLNDVL